MRFSFMSFSTPDLDFAQTLAAAKRFGYDGFEPRLESGHAHGIETGISAAQTAEIKRMAEDSGVAVCCLATGCKFADPAVSADMREKAMRTVELASALGAPAIRVFGGGIPDGFTRERSFELIVESLLTLADPAKAAGVTVCMETHDAWCDPFAVADIMNAVNKTSVAVNWDIMHPVLRAGYTVTAAFDILRPWVRHAHVHDGRMNAGKLTLLPVGEGDIDHAAALRLLKGDGYDGFVSGEWIQWEPWQTHLPRELKNLKRLLDEQII